MALPITIPNTFAGATTAIPLSQLDNNFTTVVNGVNGIGNGTNSLANVSITGGSIANVTLTGTVTAPTNGYMRNRIINGGMAIDQRNAGASQTFTAGAALAYNVDRFYGYCTGANVTGARVAGSSINQYRYQFTGAASVTAIGFGQRIEAINSYDLNNGTAFFSVDLANSLLTTVTWTAYYANTADTFGSLASPTRTQIATGTFTVTSTVTNYTASISVPSAATTGIEIVLTVGAQTSGTWTIGNVQLEAGSSSTPFERRQYGTEVMLCQRYYQNVGSNVCGNTEGTTSFAFQANFYQQMRIAPSCSVRTGFYFNVRYNGTDTNILNPSATFYNADQDGVWGIVTSSGLVINYPFVGRHANYASGVSSSDFIAASAEL
jgi:hypothetical protein